MKIMVQRRSLLTAVLACGALFSSSCNKEERNVEPASATSSSMPRTSAAKQGEMAMINWESGVMNVSAITFDADAVTSQKWGSHVHYAYSEMQTVDPLKPFFEGKALVDDGMYENLTMTMTLASNGDDPALLLKGYVLFNGDVVPVRLIVDGPVTLTDSWAKETRLSGSIDYINNVKLYMSALTSGLDEAMLQGLSMADGEIVISATSNVDVYNLMLGNMNRVLRMGF